MAKKKIETSIHLNPKDCINSKILNNIIYCKLKLQDEEVLKDSGVVKVCIDCKYFRNKK